MPSCARKTTNIANQESLLHSSSSNTTSVRKYELCNFPLMGERRLPWEQGASGSPLVKAGQRPESQSTRPTGCDLWIGGSTPPNHARGFRRCEGLGDPGRHHSNDGCELVVVVLGHDGNLA